VPAPRPSSSRRSSRPAAHAVAAGQPPADSAARALRACTYARCALRRERVVLGERLLVGERGPVVRPGLFGRLPLDSIVRAVPEAVPHAAHYRREQLRGSLLGLVGTAASAVAAVRVLGAADDCSAGTGSAACDRRGLSGTNVVLLAGGLGAGLLGGWRLQIADRALNRAVFYYNGALPR
jgi:hypothetical protein